VHKTERKLSDLQILEKMRQKLPRLENVKFEALDIQAALMSGAQNPVDIKIYGKDLNELRRIADAMVLRIKDVQGLRDLTHTLARGKPEYQIKVDREKTSRLGLTITQVGNTVQTATLGKVATRYREGSDEVDLRVRFKHEYRDNLDEIKNIPLLTPRNNTIYLDQIAKIERGEGPIQITRENQLRRVSVTANIAGRDLGSVIKDIKKRLKGMETGLPAGYFLEYGGAYEQMQDAFKVLAAALALSVLLIYMVMASQFENFLHPFVIMFTIPLGLIGVVLGLLISGRPVNLPVLIGFILLGGIAVNNGIVMIDYINQLIRRGIEKKEAILRGATTRLRPVLLTALTTVLGMLPMAFSTSEGAEMRAPLAITVLGGLTATTFMTLFIIPIIYSFVNRISFKVKTK
jgi:HAE1 family hydrophobic/amphiphilic exporter-1